MRFSATRIVPSLMTALLGPMPGKTNWLSSATLRSNLRISIDWRASGTMCGFRNSSLVLRHISCMTDHATTIWMDSINRRECTASPSDPELAYSNVENCAPWKGGGPQRETDPPGNWFAPPGSNRSNGRGNEAVGAFGVEGRDGDLASVQAIT